MNMQLHLEGFAQLPVMSDRMLLLEAHFVRQVTSGLKVVVCDADLTL